MAQSERSAKGGNPRQAVPVSAHRLFPPMVALWFAALFGIGSMILPAGLVGAALPFGAAGKLALTLLATALGAALGLVLARRVAAPQTPGPVRRREFVTPAAPSALERVSEPRRPLSVHDELDDCDLRPDRLDEDDSDRDGSPRRRTLAMQEPEGPSDWFHPPLPYSEIGDRPEQALADEDLRDDFPLELGDFAMPGDREPEIFATFDAEQEPAEAAPAFEAPASPMAASWPFEEEAGAPHDGGNQDPSAAAIPVEQRELAELGLAELTLRLDHAVRTRKARELELAQASPLIATTSPIAEDGGLGSFFGSSDPVPPPAAAPGPAAPEVPAYTARSALAAVPAALRPVVLTEVEDEEEQPATPRSLLRAPAPVDQRQMFGTPFAYAATDNGEADEPQDEELAEENYSSLAEMANPFRQGTEFVRVEEPEADSDLIEPAVVFPSHDARRGGIGFAQTPVQPQQEPAQASGFLRKSSEPVAAAVPPAVQPCDPVVQPGAAFARVPRTDPAETERALRLALATLQRMSGTA